MNFEGLRKLVVSGICAIIIGLVAIYATDTNLASTAIYALASISVGHSAIQGAIDHQKLKRNGVTYTNGNQNLPH